MKQENGSQNSALNKTEYLEHLPVESPGKKLTQSAVKLSLSPSKQTYLAGTPKMIAQASVQMPNAANATKGSAKLNGADEAQRMRVETYSMEPCLSMSRIFAPVFACPPSLVSPHDRSICHAESLNVCATPCAAAETQLCARADMRICGHVHIEIHRSYMRFVKMQIY